MVRLFDNQTVFYHYRFFLFAQVTQLYYNSNQTRDKNPEQQNPQFTVSVLLNARKDLVSERQSP